MAFYSFHFVFFCCMNSCKWCARACWVQVLTLFRWIGNYRFVEKVAICLNGEIAGFFLCCMRTVRRLVTLSLCQVDLSFSLLKDIAKDFLWVSFKLVVTNAVARGNLTEATIGVKTFNFISNPRNLVVFDQNYFSKFPFKFSTYRKGETSVQFLRDFSTVIFDCTSQEKKLRRFAQLQTKMTKKLSFGRFCYKFSE